MNAKYVIISLSYSLIILAIALFLTIRKIPFEERETFSKLLSSLKKYKNERNSIISVLLMATAGIIMGVIAITFF